MVSESGRTTYSRLAINNLSKADPELQETRFDIEPHTGMAIQFHKRMQVSQRVISKFF